MRNFRIAQTNMDAFITNKLTREQCLKILNAPPRSSMTAFAEEFGVRVALVQHVRYKCKWMLRGDTTRPVEL